MARHKNSYFLLSLGCAKNTVDSESIVALLENAGLHGTTDTTQAEVLIVNTCGFIDSAREESIESLRQLATIKTPEQYLIAAGCLAQRYGSDLVQHVPELDGVIGTRRWMDIMDVIQQVRARKHPEPVYHIPDETIAVGFDTANVSRVAIQGSSAYLKIADGCRRPCAFCAIPAIKGPVVSRPIAQVLHDTRLLRDAGIKELILIAQDTTDYGHNLGLPDGLAQLLEQLVLAVPEIPWIRIMYAYPGAISDRLINVMATHDQIVPYLDIPLQHAHRQTLLRMRRPSNMASVRDTLAKMRAAMPDLAIRTTFIVGYPGETEEEFQALVEFVEELRFDRVGCFLYSAEPGTPAITLPDQVADEVQAHRRDVLMSVQQPISLARNQAFVGRKLNVLVEGHAAATDAAGNPTGETISLARSYRDAPEIDGYVLVEDKLPVGDLVSVQVIGAMVYDLIARRDFALHASIPVRHSAPDRP